MTRGPYDRNTNIHVKRKGKGCPIHDTERWARSWSRCSLQLALSTQVTVSHPPGGTLPLLSARPAVTSPATEHHRPLAGRPTKLHCLVAEAHKVWTTCPRLLRIAASSRIWARDLLQVQRSTRCTTAPLTTFVYVLYTIVLFFFTTYTCKKE